MKYEEIFRLKHLLEYFKIPFDFKENHFDGFHLMYPRKGDCVCSVVEFDGSYGAKQDLLEIQGLMTKREERETDDTVLGYLTAVDVFNRIRKHHQKTLRLPLSKTKEALELRKAQGGI